jgi:hypothetical protein
VVGGHNAEAATEPEHRAADVEAQSDSHNAEKAQETYKSIMMLTLFAAVGVGAVAFLVRQHLDLECFLLILEY